MSDAEVAAQVVSRVEGALDRLGATGPDVAAKLASLDGRLPAEMARKAEHLLATRDRLQADPAAALEDSAAFDREAAEVLAALDAMALQPEATVPALTAAPPPVYSFRTLPPLRAERSGRRRPPPPPPPIRGLRGWRMALLVAATLATAAASIWL